MMNNKSINGVLAFFLSIGFVSISNAASTTYACDYYRYSDADGYHNVDGEFKLTFTADNDRGEGYMKGNNGDSPVAVIRQPDAITFIEVTGTGNVMTTTVDQKNQSVHSRNTVVFGKLLASQYYGSCWSLEM